MPFVYQSFNIEYSRTRLFEGSAEKRLPNSKVRTVSRKPLPKQNSLQFRFVIKGMCLFILKEIL